MTDAIAARAVANAMSFEAKKTGFGQAQDGWSLTLRIQHCDLPAPVRDAPKGTRYQCVLVELNDVDEPAEQESLPAHEEANKSRPVDVSEVKPGGTKSPGQIAGYLCTLVTFRHFLNEKWKIGCTTEYDAAVFVRYYCNVKSRSEITKDNYAWLDLYGRWQAWEREYEVVG